MARTTPEAVDYQERGPQGLSPRPSEKPHPVFGHTLGKKLLDPESLRVPKRGASGETYFDDPYLAIPNEKGGVHVTQVRAEDAAIILSCDRKSGGPPNERLATDAEIAEHLKVYGPGGHGNLLGRKF